MSGVVHYAVSGARDQSVDFSHPMPVGVSTLTPSQMMALGRSPYPSFGFTVAKFGHNPDIDTATVPEDIWAGGGVYTGFPTGAAELVEVFSSSASDTGVLSISGLDGDYAITTASVTLQGTTPVTIPTTLWKRMHTANYDSGNGTTFNLGTITVRHKTTTANVFCQMPVGTSQTQMGGYTIPAGYTGLLVRAQLLVRALIGAVSYADGFFWIRAFGASPRLRRPFSGGNGIPYMDVIDGGIQLAEKTDIIPRIIACGQNNTDVTVNYDLIVVRNAD